MFKTIWLCLVPRSYVMGCMQANTLHSTRPWMPCQFLCLFPPEPSRNTSCISNSKLNIFGSILWHRGHTGTECSTPTEFKPSKQDSCIQTVYQALRPILTLQLCLAAWEKTTWHIPLPRNVPGMLKLDVASHSCHRFGRNLSLYHSIYQQESIQEQYWLSLGPDWSDEQLSTVHVCALCLWSSQQMA